MASAKALWFGVILMAICCTLVQPGFRHSVYIFSQGLMGIKSSSLHVREKRESPTNITDYEFQAVMNISDLEMFQLLLNNLSFPIWITNTSEISSLGKTTVCSPNITGYQCMCEKNFAWSYNSCVLHKVCDAIIGDTCGCINDLPDDHQFCQRNSSQIDSALLSILILLEKSMAFDTISHSILLNK
ncbi:adhesion G protein-coupled receptor F5-like [Cyprinodon tularosa]|uniref:adhesion G protein-coupled receptor F5-like n=1 Tax=Cyprinodon tularosa TaxID=77115 RepID=UPI0018E1F6E2|nr:adhesion G protein-coupled receptor F5-like [Cyprinodon tularosa]